MNWIAGALRSKTIIVNVLALAALVFGSSEIAAFISPAHAAEVLTVVNLILRVLTSTALPDKTSLLS